MCRIGTSLLFLLALSGIPTYATPCENLTALTIQSTAITAAVAVACRPVLTGRFGSADKQLNLQIGPDGGLSKCNSTGKPEARVGQLDERGMAVLDSNNETWHTAAVFGDRCAECRYLCFCGGGCRVGRLRGVQDPSCQLRFADLENMIINRSIRVRAGR